MSKGVTLTTGIAIGWIASSVWLPIGATVGTILCRILETPPFNIEMTLFRSVCITVGCSIVPAMGIITFVMFKKFK